MKLNKNLSILVILILAMLIVTSQIFAQENIKIRALGKALIPYWDVVRRGLEQAGKDLNIDASFQAPKTGDPAEQLRIMEGFISEGADAIIFAASDPDTIISVTEDAVKKGIVIIAFDTDSPNTERLAYIGTNNYTAGAEAGKKMVEILDGEGKVAMITGSLTAMNAIERKEGFESVIKEYPGIEIVAFENDNEDSEKALRISENIISSYPDLDAFYTIYAATGPSSAKAVKQAGKSGEIKIVAFDTEPETLQFVEEGVIQAAIGQRQYFMGYLGVGLAYNVLKLSEDFLLLLPEDKIVDTGVDVVTPENIAEYYNYLDKYNIPH